MPQLEAFEVIFNFGHHISCCLFKQALTQSGHLPSDRLQQDALYACGSVGRVSGVESGRGAGGY
jgi:hypothetical protein